MKMIITAIAISIFTLPAIAHGKEKCACVNKHKATHTHCVSVAKKHTVSARLAQTAYFNRPQRINNMAVPAKVMADVCVITNHREILITECTGTTPENASRAVKEIDLRSEQSFMGNYPTGPIAPQGGNDAYHR